MSQIDKYETYRTIACLIISISTIVGQAFLCNHINNFNLELLVTFVVGFIGCSLISLSYKICNKKSEKYKKDNAKELSFESAQL